MRVWVTLPHPFGVGRTKFTRSRDEPVLSPADECPSRSRIPRRPRGREALAPRRHGRRYDAAGQAALEARSERNRRARSPVAGRRCGRLRHQRQDDDHRHGRRDPRAEAPSRLEPLGREPRLRSGVDAPDAARCRAGAPRGGRGCAARDRAPRTTPRRAARQSLPRSARPLRRAGAHRRQLAVGDRGLAGGNGARRQRGRSAGRRPRARPRQHDRLWDRRSAHTPGRRCSTRPTRATASGAAGRTSSPPRTSATSATTTALPVATPGPLSRCGRARSSSTGSRASPSSSRHRQGRPGSGCRSLASTTSTTRSGQLHWRRSSVRPSTRSGRGSNGSAPHSAASSASRPVTGRSSCC